MVTPAPPAPDRTVPLLAAVFVAVALLALGIMVCIGADNYYVRYQACQQQEQSTGIAVTWRPWSGCHATILGTDLKVGP